MKTRGRDREKANRNRMIYQLSQLGWTPKAIAEEFGISAQRVCGIKSKEHKLRPMTINYYQCVNPTLDQKIV
jgi:hypothetical protein